jgi:hypothetical protein
MTVQQTVTIPADRRLYLDLPRDTPTGEADVKLVITLKRVPRSSGVSSDQEALRFRESLNALCLNRSTFENPSPAPLEPLLGMAEESSFTVERLLQDRRAEEERDPWTTTPSTPAR